MTQPNILRIIDLCMEIDICAGQIFSELSKVYSKSGLGQFWMDRAKEEERHTLFWKALKKHAIQGVFPQVFKDPNKMIAGLESNLQRIRLFLHRDDKEFSVTRAFFVA